MAEHHLLSCLLFLLNFTKGFSDEIPVFVKTGDSVQLDIQTQLAEFSLLSWINDKSVVIVRYISGSKEAKPHPSYKDRVDFNEETFSLTLKNMQESDSGVYRAKTIGESENIIVTYRVSVIDGVEAPVLMINSNRSSSDSCTVNFTCRAQNPMINSIYQNNRCSPEEVTSHENYTLILKCSEESIICNYSNPVSWETDRINLTDLCVNNKEDATGDSKTYVQPWPFILVAVCLCLAIAFPVFVYSKCKNGSHETDNTQDEIQDQMQKETGDDHIKTIYSTVGQHQKTCRPRRNRPYDLFNGVQTTTTTHHFI